MTVIKYHNDYHILGMKVGWGILSPRQKMPCELRTRDIHQDKTLLFADQNDVKMTTRFHIAGLQV